MVRNVPPGEAWEAIRREPMAALVDVRTDAEWAYVGLPDLGAAGKQPLLLSWQVFPSMQVDPGFIDALRGAGLTARHHIYFLCRSGVRSLHAAHAAVGAGLPLSYNVADGFEGPPDEHGHRGTVAGWKAEGLPWQQR